LGGFAVGFAAAVLGLIVSNFYMPGLDWTWVVAPLLVPVLALAALVRWRPKAALAHVVIGIILFAGLAFSGEFLLGVLIARADHASP